MYRKRLLIFVVVLMVTANLSAEGQIDISSGTSKDETSKSFLEILFKSISSDNDSIINESLIEKLIEDNEKLIKIPEPELPAEPPVQHVEAQPAVSYTESVDINAIEREMILFDAVGEGWTLENYSDAAGEQTDKLKYSGREYIGGHTVFSFYPFKTGEFVVNIRRTDYTAGTVEKKRYMLNVEEAAVQNTQDNSEVLPEPNVDEVEAIIEPVVEKVKVEPAVVDSGFQNIRTAESLAAAGDCTGAAELLDKSLQNTDLSDIDAVLFKLAGYYENCSAVRDERKAVKLYSRIVDYYPVSIYWLEAKEKIIYLERNFIYIR